MNWKFFLPININSKNQKCLISEQMNPNVIEMSDWNIEIKYYFPHECISGVWFSKQNN